MLTIAFSRPRCWAWFSWLTRVVETTSFRHPSSASHALIGTDLHGVRVFLHCGDRGVQVAHRRKFERKNLIVREHEIIVDVEDGIAHAVSHLDDRYDFGALPGIAIATLIWRWFRFKVRNPFASRTAMVCSEFVLHIDHEHSIVEFDGLDPETTTPQMLVDRIIGGGGHSFGPNLVGTAAGLIAAQTR